jgi:hypothetical protein
MQKPEKHNHISDEEHQKIKFADELVVLVLNGEKEATVRYDGFESVQVGDTLLATTTDGTGFAELEVTRTASVIAVEAHDVLNVFGAKYPSTCPEDVIKSLNKHYDESIEPGTVVRVLVYEVRNRKKIVNPPSSIPNVRGVCDCRE